MSALDTLFETKLATTSDNQSPLDKLFNGENTPTSQPSPIDKLFGGQAPQTPPLNPDIKPVQTFAPTSTGGTTTPAIVNAPLPQSDMIGGLLEKLGPVQLIAKMQSGQSLPEAFASTYFTPNPDTIQRQVDLMKQGKTATEAKRIAQIEQSKNFALGFVNPDLEAINGLKGALTAAKTTEEAMGHLTNAGVPEDLAKAYAPKFAATTNPKTIQEGLDSLTNAMKTTNIPQEANRIDQSVESGLNKPNISPTKTGEQPIPEIKSPSPLYPTSETRNKVKFDIMGNTEKERVESAIVNAEKAKNEISIAGKEAAAVGQKLSPQDLKLAEGYEHGTPIADLAKESKNPALFTSFMDKLTNYYDFRLAADRAAGGTTARVENYLPHTWDLSKPEDLARFNQFAEQRGLKPYNGFHAQPRVFNSYAEGESLGFARANPNILEDLKKDYSGASNAISKQVLKQGLHEAAPESVSMSGLGRTAEGKPFVNSNIGGLEGISYHPNIDKLLKGYQPLSNTDVFRAAGEKGFEPTKLSTYPKLWESVKENGALNTVGSLFDRANTSFKHFLLNFSGFHSINVSANFAGASIFDPISGLKGLSTSIPSFFSETITQKIIDGFKSKLVSGKDYSIFDAGLRAGVNMDRGLPATGLAKLNPFTALSRAMFDRELYTLKLNLVDQVFGSGKVLPESVKGRALGKEINMIMGDMNGRTMNINPNTQKWLSRLLLAPSFTESKYKIIGDALTKGGEAGGNLARKAVVGKSLVMGTLATFGTLIATGKFPNLQQILLNYTIAPNTQTNLINAKGQKVDIAFPQTFVSEPSRPIAGLWQGSSNELIHYAQARLAPALKDAIAALTNKDYNGNPIVDPYSKESALQQIMKNVGVGSLPIGVQALTDFKSGKITAQQAAIQIAGLRTKANAASGTGSTDLNIANMIYTERPILEKQIKTYYSKGDESSAIDLMAKYNQNLLKNTLDAYRAHGYNVTDEKAFTQWLISKPSTKGGLHDLLLKPPSGKSMKTFEAKQGKPLFNRMFHLP